MQTNIKYPCLETHHVKFDDIRIAKLKRVEWVLEVLGAGAINFQEAMAINDALETVRGILAEVGG